MQETSDPEIANLDSSKLTRLSGFSPLRRRPYQQLVHIRQQFYYVSGWVLLQTPVPSTMHIASTMQTTPLLES